MENININEVLAELNAYIERVSSGCLNIAEKLKGENKSEAFQEILNFSEGMQWITSANHYLAQKGIATTVDITKVEQYLNEINDALERKDFILVADLFEYEIAPYFQEIEPVSNQS